MKVLIIRLSSIGDIVLTSPVIRCLKAQIPSVEIHYLVKKKYQDVVKNNPNIDKIHLFEDDLYKNIRKLKAEKFDFVVDLHKNIRSFRIKSALRVKSATFSKLNKEKWLLINRKINHMPGIHLVDRYFKAVSKLGVTNDQNGLDYFISNEESAEAVQIINSMASPFYAVVLGGTYFTKRYPVEKHIELIHKLDKKVILLGGKDELELAYEIQAGCGEKAINCCGNIKLNVAAGIISKAVCVFTNDTGLMHISAAFKRKTVVFWGNTMPDFGMYPYQTNHFNAEVKDLPCRPCSKLGYKKCPEGHFKCMLDINQQEILNWLNP